MSGNRTDVGVAYEIAVRRWQVRFLVRLHQVRQQLARDSVPGLPNAPADALEARVDDALATATAEGVGPRGELGPAARVKVVELCERLGLEPPP